MNILYEASRGGIHLRNGRFPRRLMQVELVNDGPVTILLDSSRTF